MLITENKLDQAPTDLEFFVSFAAFCSKIGAYPDRLGLNISAPCKQGFEQKITKVTKGEDREREDGFAAFGNVGGAEL